MDRGIGGMHEASSFFSLVAAARDRRGRLALIEALGFEPYDETVPRGAWCAYGVPDVPGLLALTVAGRAGSLDVLLVELEDPIPAAGVSAIARAVRGRNPLRLHLFVFAAPAWLSLGTFGLDEEFVHLTLGTDRVRYTDVEALCEMARRDGEEGLGLALRHSRALDRSRVTHLFFRDFRGHRDAVARAFSGIPAAADRDRAQLAILFLCRLTFLYFLQRRSLLCGDDQYLVRLLGKWENLRRERQGADKTDGAPGPSFFRARLAPLFFGALNRAPEDRSPEAASLGDLPYLNGGLFDPHVFERRYPQLDLPDAVVRSVLVDLLERYRFTSSEAASENESGYGVDPEVLGRVFEGLMDPDERGSTGSFYTPAPVVHRVVRDAVGEYLAGACPGVDPDILDRGQSIALEGDRTRVMRSLERLRVLDPACGSGAFLLGALHRLAHTLGVVSGRSVALVRRDVVARSLHGVDLLDDAALLCSLRIWLALSEEDATVRPLPNLDRRIRQGDALMDPLDMWTTGTGTMVHGRAILADPDLRRAHRAVGPAAQRYLESSSTSRDTARTELEDVERRLARTWIARLRSLNHHQLLELRSAASARDLFGNTPEQSRRAALELERAIGRRREIDDVARQLEDRGALPFFSFGVHFAEAGGTFDLIVSNPPWVRAHRWPDLLRRVAAQKYEVCRDPGWPGAPGAAGGAGGSGAQIDLSLLFVERCCRLLAPGGVLAILVPAKVLRALYGGPARRMLLRDLEIAVLEDHALDQRSIFRADAFVAVLIARRPAAKVGGSSSGREIRVRMVRRGSPPLEFHTHPLDLPLVPSDPASPWVLAPPAVAAVLRVMQSAGPPLGEHDDVRVRRGVMTGANDVLVLNAVALRLGGLARVEAAGYAAARRRGQAARAAGRFRAHVETAALRPLVRGADIDAFRYGRESCVVWCHDRDVAPVSPPPRMARYLDRHRQMLEARPGWRQGLPTGVLFRLSSDTLKPKVAWHDLSDTIRAVALPARIPFAGVERELIPLNTVYFIPVNDERDGLLLAALFNSLPVRTFARSIAERAKDARFRFFAWTMACLPLPLGTRHQRSAGDILALSERAHRDGGLDRAGQRQLDVAVAAIYGLEPDQLETLQRFDRWLRGES